MPVESQAHEIAATWGEARAFLPLSTRVTLALLGATLASLGLVAMVVGAGGLAAGALVGWKNLFAGLVVAAFGLHVAGEGLRGHRALARPAALEALGMGVGFGALAMLALWGGSLWLALTSALVGGLGSFDVARQRRLFEAPEDGPTPRLE